MKTYRAVFGELSRIAMTNHANAPFSKAALRDKAIKGITRIVRVRNGRKKKNTKGASNSGCGFNSGSITNLRRKRLVKVPVIG
jgi:hypothetical protein